MILEGSTTGSQTGYTEVNIRVIHTLFIRVINCILGLNTVQYSILGLYTVY